MLKLEGVSASYGERPVLHCISLEVSHGEMVCLIGANGAGKTTTLKTIMGLLRPTAGTISFEGSMIQGSPVNRIVKAGLSLCPEGRRVFANMTVRENLEMGGYTRKELGSADMDAIFDLFPVLRERAAQPARVLSGGEQQMLAIGRALMAKPKLLLLDEPSMGLAPIVVDRIFEIIVDIWKRGTSILLVEQNAALALEVCQRGYVIEMGEIVLQGATSDLRSDPKVQKAFLGRSR